MRVEAELRECRAALEAARRKHGARRRGLGLALRWVVGFGPLAIEVTWMATWIEHPARGPGEVVFVLGLVLYAAAVAAAMVVHGDVTRHARHLGLLAIGASTAVVLVHAPWVVFVGPSLFAAPIALTIAMLHSPRDAWPALQVLVLAATPVAFAIVHTSDAIRSARALRRPALGFRDAAWVLAGLLATFVAARVSVAVFVQLLW